MSIIIFQDDHSPFIEKMVAGITNIISTNDRLVLYSDESDANAKCDLVLDKNLTYLKNSKDYKQYSQFLDYCEKERILHAFIPRLHNPEMLLAELEVRKNLHTKITFCIFGLQDTSRSNARAETYRKLLNSDKIKALIIFSIAGHALKVPFLTKSESEKCHLFFDPIYESPSIYQGSIKDARNYLKLDQNRNYGLYFGSFFYGKGIDILVDATKKNSMNNTRIIIAGDPSTLNFDYDIDNLQKNENIIFLDRYISEEDMGKLFQAINFVILPYRQTYKDGTSGVFVQAVLANKPLICPDIYPFNDVIRNYNLGTLFLPESSDELSQAIQRTSKNYQKLTDEAHFAKYQSCIQNWEKVAKVIS